MFFLQYEQDSETQVSGGSEITDGLIYDLDGLGLEQAAQQQGAMPLIQFVCLSGNEEDRAYMTESYDIQPEDMPEPQWFTPDEGLKTVLVLLKHLQAIAEPATNDAIHWQVEALEQMAQDLSAIQAKGIRFYIAGIPD